MFMIVMAFGASYTCYENSITSYIVAQFVIVTSACVWHAVKGVGYYDPGQLTIIILNTFWIILILSNLTLQEAFREPRLCQGHASDDGYILYGNPSFEAQAISTFITFILLFNFFRTKKFRKNHFISLLIVLTIVVWGLWWTANYEFKHVISGVICGVMLGLVLCVSVYFFWVEDFPTILQLKCANWVGLKDSFCMPSKGLDMYCDPEKTDISIEKKSLYNFIGLEHT